MNPTDTISKSARDECGLANMRAIGIVCMVCGEEMSTQISDSTLRTVPLACPECGASFADEREWLIASLEAQGEAVKYAGLLQNSSLVIRRGSCGSMQWIADNTAHTRKVR